MVIDDYVSLRQLLDEQNELQKQIQAISEIERIHREIDEYVGTHIKITERVCSKEQTRSVRSDNRGIAEVERRDAAFVASRRLFSMVK